MCPFHVRMRDIVKKNCLLYIKCTTLRDFWSHFHAYGKSCCVGWHMFGQRAKPSAVHEKSLAPWTRASCSSAENWEKRLEKGRVRHLSTFWPSLCCQYRLNDRAGFSSIFLLPASLTANIWFLYSTVFHALRPSRAPGFAYAWLELISHRLLMSKLLLNTPQQKVWYSYTEIHWCYIQRKAKATPWRRLSLPNKHYNNYWWPNAVALALEGIHNADEGLNQTAHYKHYSRTYYFSLPPPPPPHHTHTPYPRLRQGGGLRPLGIVVLPPIVLYCIGSCYFPWNWMNDMNEK